MTTIKPFKKLYISQVPTVIPAGKPIVFWDTCSLIYIISIAVRNSFSDYSHYMDLLSWIENDEIVSVTSSIVWDEFNDHYQEEYERANDDIDMLRELIKNYAGIHQEPVRGQLLNLAHDINLITILENIESRVWGKTYVINEEQELAKLAHYRVLHKWSPSKVKDQYKDSYIWCTFMSVAQKLTEVRKFFMTDNKEDYCLSRKSSTPQDMIKTDCTTVGAEIYFNVGTLRGNIYRALHPEDINKEKTQ